MRAADPVTPSTRSRILEAAMEVFTDVGVEGATLVEIERRAGLTSGAGGFYRYFRSKDEVLRAAIEREVTILDRKVREGLSSLPQEDDPAEARVAAYRQRLRDLRNAQRLFRLMLNESERFPELRETVWATWSAARAFPDDLPTRKNEAEALMEAALAGYHLFTLLQGRPYRGLSEEQFTRLAVARIEDTDTL